MVRKVLQVVLGVTVLVAAGSWARADTVGCCVPTLTTCQLLDSVQCTDAKGIAEGPDCDGVRCGACCQHIAGNPNACTDDYPIVSCLEGTGTPVFNAHCAADANGQSCVPDRAAPAVGAWGIAAIGLLLATAGYWRLRRRA